MEMHELKKKSDDELKALLAELLEKAHSLRFQVANMQLKSVRDIRTTRKDISRIEGLLAQRTEEAKQTATNQPTE